MAKLNKNSNVSPQAKKVNSGGVIFIYFAIGMFFVLLAQLFPLMGISPASNGNSLVSIVDVPRIEAPSVLERAEDGLGVLAPDNTEGVKTNFPTNAFSGVDSTVNSFWSIFQALLFFAGVVSTAMGFLRMRDAR